MDSHEAYSLFDREPWPHQVFALTQAVDAIQHGESSCVTAPTGSGKTVILTALIRWCGQNHKKVILYTNRRMLTDQTMRVLDAHHIEYGVIAATHKDRRATLRDVQLASIQTVHSRVNRLKSQELWKADVVLIDECFVAETEILTQRGVTSIDKVAPGDKVYCAAGIGTVVCATCRPATDTYKVEFSNGRHIECTGNHRIFTNNGWVRARNLGKGQIVFSPEDVSDLWESVSTAQVDKPKEGRAGNSGVVLERASNLLTVLRKEVQESDGQSNFTDEDGKDAEANWSQADCERRQRAVASLAAARVASCTRLWVGVGVSSTDKVSNRKRRRHSAVLQGGYSKSNSNGGNRNRRSLPRCGVPKSVRRKENGDPNVVRVVSVSRVKRQGTVPVYNLQVSGHPSYFANGVLVHNCHAQANGVNEKILRAHQQQGAVLMGFTATPMGVAHIYPHLIIAGRNSDCRACGALVPARIYAPSELDTSKLKLQDNGEFNYEDIKKYCWTGAIFGHVLDHWKSVNPSAYPAIGFAPGVAESKWFVDQFASKGVRCAHIDGEDCYIDGEEIPSSQETRDEIIAELKAGKVAIVWNRFVLREGIDLPFVYHGILATPFGSMMSYVQACGRILRYSPETADHVIITDHAGNYWRHTSPNADFDWQKWYFDNPSLPTRMKLNALRERKELSPIVCDKCGAVRRGGWSCPFCGHTMQKKRRMVIQRDGTLRPMYGEPLPRKIVREKPDTYSKWTSMYHRMKKANRSFAQAIGFFVHEYGYWPPSDLPLMPKIDYHTFSKIKDVKVDELISTADHIEMREAAGKKPVPGVVDHLIQGKIF